MNYKVLILVLFFKTFFTYSQNRSIAFFDDNKEPITNFQLNFFIKDSLSIFKNNTNSNTYFFDEKFSRKLDSVFVAFDSFYSEIIAKDDFIKKDSIFLRKEISLDEVILNKKIIREQLGVVSKPRNIFKIGDASKTEKLIEINVRDFVGSKIESINLYIFEKFRDLHNKKHKNKNLDIKFFLFQSNTNPNEDIENLLKNELIVNTQKGNKGWINVDLSHLNIKIKDYKYLYVGYSSFGAPFAIGSVKRKRIITNDIKSYMRTSDKIQNRKWYESHYKTDVADKELSEPAIKIEIKY